MLAWVGGRRQVAVRLAVAVEALGCAIGGCELTQHGIVIAGAVVVQPARRILPLAGVAPTGRQVVGGAGGGRANPLCHTLPFGPVQPDDGRAFLALRALDHVSTPRAT